MNTEQLRPKLTVLSADEVTHYATCCVTTEDAIRAAEQKILARALTQRPAAPATPEPVGEQITSEMLAAGRKAIHETLGASSAGIARCVYESMRAAQPSGGEE